MLLLAGCTVPGVLLPENDILRDVYLRGSPRVPTVALTFDDGPNGRCTDAVLDALRDAGVRATFFVLGANVAPGRNDALLARMVREGHTIGIHSHTHAVRPLFWRDLSEAEIHRAMVAVHDALVRDGIAVPPPVTLYRPPFGMLLGPEVRAATEAHLRIIEWTVSVGDWRAGRTAPEVTDDILARVRPGDVIVLHDGNYVYQRSLERCVDRPIVAEVVRRLVPALAARGLRPAPLADVLQLD